MSFAYNYNNTEYIWNINAIGSLVKTCVWLFVGGHPFRRKGHIFNFYNCY